MAVQEYLFTVEYFREVNPTLFELGFRPDKPLSFIAGQFLSITIPGAAASGKDLKRAYSIASVPEKDVLEICVRRVEGGPGTTYLGKLRPGDQFKGQASYGHFVYKPKLDRDFYFIATGTGVTPYRSICMGKNFRENPARKTTVLFGVRDQDDLIYKSEFESVRNIVQWIPCVSRPGVGWSGFHGRVTDWLVKNASTINFSESEFYLCGAGVMIDEVKKILSEKGVLKEAIQQEIYFRG